MITRREWLVSTIDLFGASAFRVLNIPVNNARCSNAVER